MNRLLLPSLIAVVLLPALTSVADAKDTKMAPAPFTADQWREACRVGLVYHLRQRGGPSTGQVTLVEVLAVTESDRTVRTTLKDARGKQLVKPSESTTTWEKLAEPDFEASRTTVTETTITVPGGTYECLCYAVKHRDFRGNDDLRYYYFAKSLPGPPIKVSMQLRGKEVVVELQKAPVAPGESTKTTPPADAPTKTAPKTWGCSLSEPGDAGGGAPWVPLGLLTGAGLFLLRGRA